MAQIKDKKQYDAIMARIDELFFATDENTPKDDKRLLELDVLSAPRLCDIIGGKKTPTYEQARIISKKLDIDPSIVLAL